MYLKIPGVLTKRLKKCAISHGQKTAELTMKALKKGLNFFERRGKSVLVTKANKDFIRANWNTLSDSDMVEKLSIKLDVVRHCRYRLGLLRTRGPFVPGRPGTYRNSSVELSDAQAAFTRSNNHLGHKRIAVLFGVPFQLIKKFRIHIAEPYVQEHFGEETDGAMGKNFGLTEQEVRLMRLHLKLFRDRPKTNLEQLGTESEIRFALTNGGWSFSSLAREKGVPLSRERVRQLASIWGLTGKPKNRTPLWNGAKIVAGIKQPIRPYDRLRLAYALSDRSYVIERLAKLKSVPALAAEINCTPGVLYQQVRRLGIIPFANRGQTVPLVCSYERCGKDFFRELRYVQREQKRRPERKTHFCSHVCQGRYLSEHYGMGTSPLITKLCVRCVQPFTVRARTIDMLAKRGKRIELCPSCRK